MKKYLTICFLILLNLPLFAQDSSDWIFDDIILPEVHITINQEYLDLILHPDSLLKDHEYPAIFEFIKGNQSEIVENIGFRIRGNTSRHSHKKSFKVSFNAFESGRQYRGLDKMNLNGEHNDPSIIRSKLSWDIFQNIGLPAPRANHVKLYINEEYYGLYINVEHIDDEFVEDRFGTDAGNLYKCLYPADLTYRGSDPAAYREFYNDRGQVYELKTNEEKNDYSDLAYLINFFEHATDTKFQQEIEDYLNVDGVLRSLAVDVLTGNWDDYWFNKNNFYLYNNPTTNRFEFIPYDYDNTFGIWWDGIYSGMDWGLRDINTWGHPDEYRPLTHRILSIEEYRNRFNYYVNRYLDEVFNSDALLGKINLLKLMVEDAAEDDTYRTLDYGYSISDYHNSFNEGLGDHTQYGLKPYISTRYHSAKEQVLLKDITPVIRSVTEELVFAQQQSALLIQAEIIDEENPTVYLMVSSSDEHQFEMNDEGNGADLKENDSIFSAIIPLRASEQSLSYYIEATDTESKTGRFPNNPSRNVLLELKQPLGTIVINEFMADNESTILDDVGDYEDWIELYNTTDNPINLKNYYLTDDFSEPKKWALPDSTIQPSAFLLIWADNDDEEGPLHTNFGLSNDGEEVGLYFQDVLELKMVDTLSFGPQSDDISYGRQPDGNDTFVYFDSPTPGTSNNNATSNEEKSSIPNTLKLNQNYPNPFNPVTVISYQLAENSVVTLEVFDMLGRKVETLISNQQKMAGSHEIRFDASGLSSGVYIYQLTSGNQIINRKFTLIK